MSDEDAGTAGRDRKAGWPDDAAGWLRILDEPEESRRQEAAEWLATRGLAADRAVPILADLLRREFADGEPSHYDAEMWLNYEINLLMNYGAAAAPAAPVLIDGLGNRNWQIRAKAAEALGRMGPAGAAAVPILRELLRRFDPSNRLTIWRHVRFAEALWHLSRDPEAVEILLDIFAGDPDWNGDVDKALGRIGPASPAVMTALMDALRAEGRNYSTAVSTLEEIGPPAHEAVPLLSRALAGEGVWGRMQAARALWRITGEAGPSVAALAAALDDPNERVGRWGAYCLGEMGPAAAAALPALRRKRDQAEGEYKESCLRPVPRKLLFVEAVGVVEGSLPSWRLGFTGDLRLLLDELDGPDESHRRWAAEFIAQLGPEAWTAIPALRRELARAEGEYVDLLGVRRPAKEPFQRALAAINEAMGESDDVASYDERRNVDG